MARQVPFCGKRRSVRLKRQLVAHEVDEVGGVAAVQDGEAGVEADRVGVVAQQAGAHAVEGAGPFQPAGEAAVAAERLAADPLGTARPSPRPRAG